MCHWTGDLGNSSDSCLVMLPVEAYYPSLPMSETDNNVPSRSGYNLSSTASHTGDNVIITLPESGETHPIRSELVLTTAKQETSVSIKEAQHKQSPKSFGGGFGELQGISKKNKVLKYGQKIELYNKTPPIKIKLERMVRTNKLLWTAELHRIFLKAVRKLGMESTPNAIREEMNVEGLTRDNVASHLQKYRTRVRAAKTDDEKEALLKQEEEFLSQSDDTQSFPSSPIPHSAKSSAPPATYLRAPLPQQTMPSADSFNLLNNAAPGSNQLFSGMPVAPQFSNYSPSMLPQANYLPSPQSFPRPQFLPSSQTIPPFNPNYFYNQVATAQQQQPQQPQQSQQSQPSQQPQQPQQARQPQQPQQRTQLYYLRQEEIKEEFKDYNYYP